MATQQFLVLVPRPHTLQFGRLEIELSAECPVVACDSASDAVHKEV
jgi:hypothetical protein